MINPEMKESMGTMFHMRDFESMWLQLNAEYELLGIGVDMTDVERIAEYTSITKQLRKYMSTKQDQVLGHDSIEDMMEEVEQLISKAPEYGENRPTLVYNFMRDKWLVELYTMLANMLEEMTEDDEEGSY